MNVTSATKHLPGTLCSSETRRDYTAVLLVCLMENEMYHRARQLQMMVVYLNGKKTQVISFMRQICKWTEWSGRRLHHVSLE
jgi:hypothetical protein